MLVLDTDHFSEWERKAAPGLRLKARLDAYTGDAALAVATVQEILQGRLAELNQHNDKPHRQVLPYDRFKQQVEIVAMWAILRWDNEAADLFLKHRRGGVRIGTMDLKIACIVIVHDATLLTRNTRDFAQVPGLRFENWLD